MSVGNLTALLSELNDAVLVYRSETDTLRNATADLKLKVTIGIGLILLILIIEMAMLFGTIFYTCTKHRPEFAYKVLDNKVKTITITSNLTGQVDQKPSPNV